MQEYIIKADPEFPFSDAAVPSIRITSHEYHINGGRLGKAELVRFSIDSVLFYGLPEEIHW